MRQVMLVALLSPNGLSSLSFVVVRGVRNGNPNIMVVGFLISDHGSWPDKVCVRTVSAKRQPNANMLKA